jgi:predicted nucleic acid-binding protein
MKKLVDTSILIYLIDSKEKEKHLKAVEWFENIFGSNDYFISTQNLREFAFVAKNKALIETEETKKYLDLFAESFNIIQDSIEDIKKACETTKKKYWDALLIATAKRNNIFQIITENEKDFVNEISVLNILK